MTGWPCGDRGVIEGPRTLNHWPSKSTVCTFSASRKRSVAASRISASSSQLSQSRRTTSTTSSASAKRRRDRLVHAGVAEVVERGNVAAPEVARLVPATRHLRLPAGAAEARVVERRDRLRDVERLGVGRRDGGDQSDAAGDRRDARRDQQGVQAAAHLVGALVRTERRLDCRANESSIVAKSMPPGVGPLHDVDPVLRGEELVGPRGFLAPRGGVPAGALECDAETQSVSGGHQCSCSSKSVARRFRASDVSIAAPRPTRAPGASKGVMRLHAR